MTKGLGESSFHNIMCCCLPVTTGLYFYFEKFKTCSWSVRSSSFGQVLVLQVQGAEFNPQNHTHKKSVVVYPCNSSPGKRRMCAMNRIYWSITLAELASSSVSTSASKFEVVESMWWVSTCMLCSYIHAGKTFTHKINYLVNFKKYFFKKTHFYGNLITQVWSLKPSWRWEEIKEVAPQSCPLTSSTGMLWHACVYTYHIYQVMMMKKKLNFLKLGSH